MYFVAKLKSIKTLGLAAGGQGVGEESRRRRKEVDYREPLLVFSSDDEDEEKSANEEEKKESEWEMAYFKGYCKSFVIFLWD